jgi:hypothetical protein
MRTLSALMIAAGMLGTVVAGAGVTSAAAQGVYVEGPGFGVGIGRPAYGERHYRGYYDYAGPRVYSERRFHRGPHVLERHSYRWRGRTGIDYRSADSRSSSECIALAAFFVKNGHLVG